MSRARLRLNIAEALRFRAAYRRGAALVMMAELRADGDDTTSYNYALANLSLAIAGFTDGLADCISPKCQECERPLDSPGCIPGNGHVANSGTEATS